MSDPAEQASARIRAAADQFGAALGDAVKLGLRQAVAEQIAEQFGPGPWVLHEDGRVEPATGSASEEPPWLPRILWNKRGGDIDEVVLNGNVHIEQMDNRCWWIGIHVPGGGYWSGNFHCDSRGRMTFTEQDHAGFDWDRDDTHETQTKKEEEQ